MSEIVELFGESVFNQTKNWQGILNAQSCAYTNRPCYKTRKSDPSIAIGTCTVLYGSPKLPIAICPNRLTQNRQIFADCIGLMSRHEIGNELHIVPEVSVPGGHVDFVLVSARDGSVRDFVGIELQTLDTTGTVWPARQRLLQSMGLPAYGAIEDKSFGMNWKMTAKTILVQMHHKVQTFEHVGRKLALVIQDHLLDYMRCNFKFSHVHSPALAGDSLHIHSYRLNPQPDSSLRLAFNEAISTDADGVSECLGLQAEARVELEQITRALEAKMGRHTVFHVI
jgi:hypothetical protein